MGNLPEWLGTLLVGALIAAFGYVSKLAIELLSKWEATRRERQARLVALQSLLLASKSVFDIQNAMVGRLCDEIREQHPEIGGTYDRILASGYAHMNERQKLEHGLIRNYTSSCLLPLNAQMIDWLSADTYYKGAGRRGAAKDLSGALQRLEAHLILWRAKYHFWKPDKPEHAIVYMADEEGHGISFPKGIEALIARITGGTIEPTRLPASQTSWNVEPDRQ
jgi:hypothetical protein